MREIRDLSTYKSLTPSQMANTIFHCSECCSEHQIPFKFVDAGEGLISTIPEVIKKMIGKKPKQTGVIFDCNIEDKISDLFLNVLNGLGLPIVLVPLGERGSLLEASIVIGDQTAQSLSNDIEFLIGVGSGVISDLTKWVATKRSIPFLIAGTAASMNAYTSITGSMTEGNVKTSKWLDPASVVLLDTDLMASGPVEMTCAGFGDLMARNVANADWKLSECLRGTYFCPVPFQIMEPYQARYLRNISDFGIKSKSSIDALSQANLVSGYSMTILDGETSPSSGSEHIISHFFDFQHEIFNLPKNLHGTQVGVGTIMMSTAYELMRAIDPAKLNIDEIEHRRLTQSAVQLDLKHVFGQHADDFSKAAVDKRISDFEFRPYIEKLIKNWRDIWDDVMPYLMSANEIRTRFEEAGAVVKLPGIDRSEEDGLQALLYGAHYRPRYTILDLFWELGLFPEYATEILYRSGVLD